MHEGGCRWRIASVRTPPMPASLAGAATASRPSTRTRRPSSRRGAGGTDDEHHLGGHGDHRARLSARVTAARDEALVMSPRIRRQARLAPACASRSTASISPDGVRGVDGPAPRRQARPGTPLPAITGMPPASLALKASAAPAAWAATRRPRQPPSRTPSCDARPPTRAGDANTPGRSGGLHAPPPVTGSSPTPADFATSFSGSRPTDSSSHARDALPVPESPDSSRGPRATRHRAQAALPGGSPSS